jgi:hypothetical protein
MGDEAVAHFRVSVGWCGGHGEAILDGDNRIRRIDDLPLFLDEDGRRRIEEAVDLSLARSAIPAVRVTARVRPEAKKSRNYTIPGAPRERYALLVVTELLAARVETEEP